MFNQQSPQYACHLSVRARSERQRLQRRIAAASIAAVMAEVMTDRTAASDACTEDDLLAAGFTREEIAAHAEPARKLAARRAGRA